MSMINRLRDSFLGVRQIVTSLCRGPEARTAPPLARRGVVDDLHIVEGFSFMASVADRSIIGEGYRQLHTPGTPFP
jgi:hypothetical protein